MKLPLRFLPRFMKTAPPATWKTFTTLSGQISFARLPKWYNPSFLICPFNGIVYQTHIYVRISCAIRLFPIGDRSIGSIS